MDHIVPEGFVRHYRHSPLTEPWEPLFSRMTDECVAIGLVASRAHTNSRGFVHGGLIAALVDNAMGLTCGQVVEGLTGLVTVNLAIDYVGSAAVGEWLQITPSVVKAGSSLCFAQAIVTADGRRCARANATFKVASRTA